MNKILLVSEAYIKSNSGLDDNVFGKFLLPAIREAQDINLQSIIGTALFNKICAMVGDGTIKNEENWDYKYLLDNHIQPYLLYMTLCNILPLIGSKIANIGTVYTNDEHVQNLSKNERDNLADYYEQRSTFYARKMQNYLSKNSIIYPELNDCDCADVKPNLKSAAVSPVWLGGIRGKKL